MRARQEDGTAQSGSGPPVRMGGVWVPGGLLSFDRVGVRRWGCWSVGWGRQGGGWSRRGAVSWNGGPVEGLRVLSAIRVELFGATAVVLPDGSRVTDLGGIKPRQVLEMLALSVGAPVSKDRLVEQLWGGNPPRTFMATLESYISLLRRRLGVGRGRGSALAT